MQNLYFRKKQEAKISLIKGMNFSQSARFSRNYALIFNYKLLVNQQKHRQKSAEHNLDFCMPLAKLKVNKGRS